MRLPKILLVFLIFCTSLTYAQSELITQLNGKWKFTQYSPDIIKLTFTPDNYTTNENISDAVILKPMAKVISTAIKNNSAIVKNKKLTVNITPAKTDGYYGFDISLANDEKIYGGGERALPLNRRGYKFNLYNSPHYGYGEGAENLNYSVPFFTSSNGYGIFFDNASKGYADIGKTNADIFQAGFVSGELNVYLIFGNDNKEILANYYKLTGSQPLPPRWAMGNLMSRFGYTSQKEANEIVAKMRAENIPLDAIIFDLFWFGDSIQNTLGNLAWVNKTKWPDPKKMISDFKKKNINTILITEPFIVKSSLNYNNTIKYQAVDSSGKNPFMLTNFYFGKGGLLDIYRTDAQKWFWNKHKEQMKIGVEGWWGDLGEPETHPSDMYHNLKDLGYKRLFKADEVHNIYGHTWTKMLFTQFAKEYPTKRLFSLNRSGFAGSQRYGIFPWTGDVSRSWSGLRAQLPVILGMSMSGVPYVHSDAGGFAGGEGDNELYVRWLQFATFTPIFRPHGTALGDVDKNAFSFPSEAALIEEPYRRHAQVTIGLRYNLLPYNYTLAYKQAKKGEPLIAPLYYHFPKDTAAVNVSDEFMWGENILVVPVLQKGEQTKNIYLPAGKWYSLTDTSVLYGDKWIKRKITLDNIPLFVKEGSFIPMWLRVIPMITSTADYNIDKDSSLRIVYYPSEKKSSGFLYNDDGVTKNAGSEIINFEGITIGNKVTIKMNTNNKLLYKNGQKKTLLVGIPYSVKCTFDLTNTCPMIKLNNKPIDTRDIVKTNYGFNPSTTFNYIKVRFDGTPLKVEIEIQP
ncbi:MAG: TIM-barrel domain-containing protein [Bacteroidota bacterium]